ncbi:hypothetical protein CSB09_01390, partial [Candidatus Gracilibacteria bacterium]
IKKHSKIAVLLPENNVLTSIIHIVCVLVVSLLYLKEGKSKFFFEKTLQNTFLHLLLQYSLFERGKKRSGNKFLDDKVTGTTGKKVVIPA